MLLPTIVAKLEREETKADVIFRKLRNRFPHNAAVMRHYALFLEEVKNEPELAYALFKQADEIEQESATRHTFHASVCLEIFNLSLLTVCSMPLLAKRMVR